MTFGSKPDQSQHLLRSGPRNSRLGQGSPLPEEEPQGFLARSTKQTYSTMLILNIVSLVLLTAVLVVGSQTNQGKRDPYIQFFLGNGPFVIFNITVDVWWKYGLFVILIGFLGALDLFIRDLAMNDLYNIIYNFNVDNMKTFQSESEVKQYARSMYFINSARNLVFLKIAVTRLDLGLFYIISVFIAREITMKSNLYKKIKKKTQADEKDSAFAATE